MAFVPGINTRYFVGPMRFSVFGKSIDVTVTCNQLEVSSHEDRAQVYINGQKTGSASIDMMLDTAYAATSQFTTLNTWQATPQPVTVGFDGTALAASVWMILGNESGVTFSDTASDIAAATVAIQPDGPIDWGQVIATEAAVTVDGNGTAVDGGASSSNGGVAHVHTTAFSGLTNNIITIEGSADGSTGWATISGGTFSTITAVGSERLVIAAGVSVPRYLRAVDNVTGSGTTTRLVSFARR
jgi:hypothetical protein